jgi:HEPN domain-containing protein
LSLNKKRIRETTGYTFFEVRSDHENWISRARAFKVAAELIAGDEYSPPVPYYYNAGISLELILKAIAIAKGQIFKTNHRLNELCQLVGINVSNDQKCTLELLSELIVWSGRYPAPKSAGQWDNYHDVVQEKHIVRKHEGNAWLVIANRERFPTLDNFKGLWNIFEKEYVSSVNEQA